MLDRRETLALLGSGALASLPGSGIAQVGGDRPSFRHGVASGDPSSDGAVLWTRVTPAAPAGAIRLRWQVNEVASGRPAGSGTVLAGAARDFTAKVAAAGLKPATEYAYRFATEAGAVSPEGRFRTLPVGRVDRLDLAFACCQLHQGGYFHAFAAMAALDRLDAVVHLGDYIYEYGADHPVHGGAVAQRAPEPPHEAVTLADYRARHAQVKRDPDLQAAHARAAFICIWDDHEFANNAWVEGADNHQPQVEGRWAARKAAALQAWSEWMPVRESSLPMPRAAFRAFRFGDLATLFMLETRLLARAGLPAELRDGASSEEIARGLKQLSAPGRDLLGPEQRAWLESALSRSVAGQQPWQLVCSPVVMAPVAGPDPAALLGEAGFAGLSAGLVPPLRRELLARIDRYRQGVPFNLDSWDGFPVARADLYRLFQRAKALPLVLSGDSHAFWANNLHDEKGALAAREFGVTAVSSPGYGEAMPGLPLGQLLAMQNRDVLFSDQSAKGFVRLRLEPGSATAELVRTSDAKSKRFSSSVLRRFTVEPRGRMREAAP